MAKKNKLEVETELASEASSEADSCLGVAKRGLAGCGLWVKKNKKIKELKLRIRLTSFGSWHHIHVTTGTNNKYIVH